MFRLRLNMIVNYGQMFRLSAQRDNKIGLFELLNIRYFVIAPTNALADF